MTTMSQPRRHLDVRTKMWLWACCVSSGLLLPSGWMLWAYAGAVIGVSSLVFDRLRPLLRFAIRIVLPTFVMLVVVYGFLVPYESAANHQSDWMERFFLGVFVASAIGARLLVIGTATIVFVSVTPQLQIASGLRAMRVPVPVVAVFVSSFNMYGSVVRKIRQIVDAQRSRGLSGRGLRGRVRMYIPILRPLLFSMLTSAVERASVWRTRNYLGMVGSTELEIGFYDTIVATLGALLVGGAGVARCVGC